MPAQDHVSIVIVGPHKWSTFSAFNGNAFPDDLKSIVDSCATRLSLVSANVHALTYEVQTERVSFMNELNSDRAQLSDGIASRPDLRFVAYADGAGYIAALYGLLSSARSFLDIYALLMGKLIGRHLSWSFKRGRVDGKEVSGGTILNWLNRSAPKDLAHAGELAHVIRSHVEAWIGTMVDYRDTVSHYSEIRGLTHMHVALNNVPPLFIAETLDEPRMPDGMLIVEYGQFIKLSLRNFVSDTLSLLPNVKQDLIQPNRLFT